MCSYSSICGTVVGALGKHGCHHNHKREPHSCKHRIFLQHTCWTPWGESFKEAQIQGQGDLNYNPPLKWLYICTCTHTHTNKLSGSLMHIKRDEPAWRWHQGLRGRMWLTSPLDHWLPRSQSLSFNRVIVLTIALTGLWGRLNPLVDGCHGFQSHNRGPERAYKGLF